MDTQIKHLDNKSLESLGIWLRRRWFHCQTKKGVAEAALTEVAMEENALRAEWKAQVKAQTKPAPSMLTKSLLDIFIDYFVGQSKTKGKQAVEAVLALDQALLLHRKRVSELELALSDASDVTDVSGQLDDVREHVRKLERSLSQKKRSLGVSEQANLTRLKNNEFLRLRMNALALKQRLRDRLRQRKFEIEKLERNYRHTANGMFINAIRLNTNICIRAEAASPHGVFTQETGTYNNKTCKRLQCPMSTASRLSPSG